jgi:glycosyltransferase involved in cell wall biosynthesis
VPANKAVVLHNGSSNGVDASARYNRDLITADQVREIRDGLLLPPNALVVGVVGRLVRDKGVVDLHNAWSVVRNTHPDAHLVIIGCYERADPIPDEVRASLEADSRVRLVTDGRDAAPYYALMEVLVHPSHREGFPNVVLEASAMEVPVVTTDAVGCIDSVQDGVTGSVVPVGDAPRLATAVQMYLSSDVLRRTHGCAGRERALRDFAPEDIWRALLDTFHTLLSHPASS